MAVIDKRSNKISPKTWTWQWLCWREGKSNRQQTKTHQTHATNFDFLLFIHLCYFTALLLSHGLLCCMSIVRWCVRNKILVDLTILAHSFYCGKHTAIFLSSIFVYAVTATVWMNEGRGWKRNKKRKKWILRIFTSARSAAIFRWRGRIFWIAWHASIHTHSRKKGFSLLSSSAYLGKSPSFITMSKSLRKTATEWIRKKSKRMNEYRMEKKW